MLNLDNEHIDFPCPRCNFYNDVSLKQVRLRDVTICRGCKSNIRLDDQMNETKKAIRSIRRAFKELEKTINNMNLEIRI